MSDEDRSKLFLPYFKSGDAASRELNPESNGLGLSISKRLATALGCDLSISDDYQDGCKFELSMNLERVNDQRQAGYNFPQRFGRQRRNRRVKYRREPQMPLVNEEEDESAESEQVSEADSRPYDAEAEESQQQEDFPPGKILIAEDNIHCLRVLQVNLDKLGKGSECIFLSNGEELVQ